jgi:hypothetical protein
LEEGEEWEEWEEWERGRREKIWFSLFLKMLLLF